VMVFGAPVPGITQRLAMLGEPDAFPDRGIGRPPGHHGGLVEHRKPQHRGLLEDSRRMRCGAGAMQGVPSADRPRPDAGPEAAVPDTAPGSATFYTSRPN